LEVGDACERRPVDRVASNRIATRERCKRTERVETTGGCADCRAPPFRIDRSGAPERDRPALEISASPRGPLGERRTQLVAHIAQRGEQVAPHRYRCFRGGGWSRGAMIGDEI